MIYKKVAEKITESIEEAIKELKCFIDESMTDEYKDDVFILYSRYKDVIRKSRLGIVSVENSNIEENKIRVDVLNLSKEIDESLIKSKGEFQGLKNITQKNIDNKILKKIVGEFAFWEFPAWNNSAGFVSYEYMDFHERETELGIKTLILYGQGKDGIKRIVSNISFDLKEIISMEMKGLDSVPNDKSGFSIERYPSKLSVDCIKIYSKGKVIKDERIDMLSYEKEIEMNDELEIIVLNDKYLLEEIYKYMRNKWESV